MERAASNEQFRRMFEYAPEAILVLDAKTCHIVDVNEYAERLLAYPKEQLISMRIFDLEPAGDGLSCAVGDKYGPVRHEATYITGDGRRVEVESTSMATEYAGCDALMLYVRDVTERNAAQRALNHQAEFNALITDVSRSFINVSEVNISVQIERALGRIGRFLGLDRSYIFRFEGASSMVNTHEWCDERMPSSKETFECAQPVVFPAIMRTLASGHDVHIPDVETAKGLTAPEREALAATGVRAMLAVPMTVAGATVGFMGYDSLSEPRSWPAEVIALLRVTADIVATASARTAAECELRKLSRAIEQSPVAVFITDADGAIEYVNPKFTELTGYAAHEVLGKNPRILKSGLTPDHVYRDLWRTVASGREWNGMFINWRKRRTPYWASATISAMRSDDGEITHYVCVQEDITEKKEAEESLKEAKQQAEAANTAKSEFLATMSHEIRTPMNAIIGMAELLHDTELSEQQSQYVEVFRQAGESLLELINSVLDLSKIEAGKFEIDHVPMDLREMARSVVAVMGPIAKDKGLELNLDLGAGVPSGVLGDPARLRQVLMNLLGNAIKFTGEGSVSLAVASDEDSQHVMEVTFSVTDTGIGIAPGMLDAIFDSFTQADSSTTRTYGGTGLGLTISKHLIELMGGDLEVESAPGEGSTFHFAVMFELSSGPDAAAKAPRVVATQPSRPLRILLAEDNEDNRFLIRRYMDSTPHEVVEAVNGREAVSAFTSADKPFDLVLMDMQMPEMDGYEATAALRAWEAGHGLDRTTVLALSAYALKGEIARSIEAGCDGHLVKPIKKKTLLDAIAEATASDTPPPAAPPASAPSEFVAYVERSLEDLIPGYLENRRDDVSAIRAAVSDGDLATAKRLGHTMKGSGGGYGFDHITAYGALIERDAEAGHSDAVLAAVAKLERYLAEVEIEIVEDE